MLASLYKYFFCSYARNINIRKVVSFLHNVYFFFVCRCGASFFFWWGWARMIKCETQHQFILYGIRIYFYIGDICF